MGGNEVPPARCGHLVGRDKAQCKQLLLSMTGRAGKAQAKGQLLQAGGWQAGGREAPPCGQSAHKGGVRCSHQACGPADLSGRVLGHFCVVGGLQGMAARCVPGNRGAQQTG